MASVSRNTVFIKGKLFWAKVLGEPRPNYGGDAREWSFELELDEAGIQTFLKNGIADRIKGKGYNLGTKGQHKDREPFIQLKKPELNKEGEKNKPIRVYDNEDQPWGEDLIGNGTEAYVKIDIRNYGAGRKSGVYPVAIKVLDLVEYHSSEFGGAQEEEVENPAPATASKKGGSVVDLLDDPLP